MKKSLHHIKTQFAEKTISLDASKELKGGYWWRIRSSNLSIGVDCFGICGDAD